MVYNSSTKIKNCEDTGKTEDHYSYMVAHAHKGNFTFSSHSSAHDWTFNTDDTAHIFFIKKHRSNITKTAPFIFGMKGDPSVKAHGYIDTRLVALVGNEEFHCNLLEILYVLDLKCNYFPVYLADELSSSTIFQ